MVCLFAIMEGNLGNIYIYIYIYIYIGGMSVVGQDFSNLINLLDVSKLLRPFNEITGFFN
jgi:hypothetical protein